MKNDYKENFSKRKLVLVRLQIYTVFILLKLVNTAWLLWQPRTLPASENSTMPMMSGGAIGLLATWKSIHSVHPIWEQWPLTLIDHTLLFSDTKRSLPNRLVRAPEDQCSVTDTISKTIHFGIWHCCFWEITGIDVPPQSGKTLRLSPSRTFTFGNKAVVG